MASPATPAASTTPHPSWYARAGTWFVKIGRAVKNAFTEAASKIPVIDSAIQKAAPTVEALSNMVLPGSGDFEAHLLDVWGVAANAVKDAGAAAGSNAINITLDQALVNDIKGFLPAVEAYLHPAASPSPAPANPPTPTVTPASGGGD